MASPKRKESKAMGYADVPIVEATIVEDTYQDDDTSDVNRKMENANNSSHHSMSIRSNRSTYSMGNSSTNSNNIDSHSSSMRMNTKPSTNVNVKNLWPPKLREAIVATFNRPLSQVGTQNFLIGKHQWPKGLVDMFVKAVDKIPIRFFIIDDSGSMGTTDGCRTHGKGVDTKVVKCSRWTELTQSLDMLAHLSDAACVPSEFRLLNGADPCFVGLSATPNDEDLAFVKDALTQEPLGQTPLCEQINAVVHNIESIKEELIKCRKKAAVIIATDGEATDGDVTAALRPLQYLPVWLVIRLCTNEKSVVDYWNKIDGQLEMEIDVLDDMVSDAVEVYSKNPWLVYGESLHRLREFGTLIKELDLMDEKLLSHDHMYNMCANILFDGDKSNLSHPSSGISAFINQIKANNNKHSVFCCHRKKMTHWIDEKYLKLCYQDEYKNDNDKVSAVCNIC